MGNVYRDLPEYAKSKNQLHMATQVEGAFKKGAEATIKFFEDIAKRSASQWPRSLRENCYAFAWPGEDFRDLFLHLLFTPLAGRTHHVAKDVMRFMLFRMRIAEKLKVIPVQGQGMEKFRWRYFMMPEMASFLQKDDRHLRDAVKWLVDRGLLVRVYVPGKTKYPYFRPSDDLFRICTKVTFMADVDYLRAHFGGTVLPNEQAIYRRQCMAILTERTAVVHALAAAFMASSAPDRAAVFCDGYDVLTREFWPAILGEDDERYAEGWSS